MSSIIGRDFTPGVLLELAKAGERAAMRIGMAVTSEYKRNLRDRLNTTGQAAGDLMNSASYEVDKKGLDSTITVGNTKIYSRIHEFGGVITAKKDYLTFQTADGEWHRVASVTIPARPTLRPAILEHLPGVANVVAEEMMR